MHKLPAPNFHLLRALYGYLDVIVQRSDVNKMDIRNLSIVFSPTLSIPTPVILMFLTRFDAIFGDATGEAALQDTDLPGSQTLTADDIRSPRRQMFSDLPTPAFNQTTFVDNQEKGRKGSAGSGMQMQQEFGFAPLQPTYDGLGSSQSVQSGAGFAVARPRNLTPGDNAIKQSRRESSMMLMGPGSRKSSVPMLGGE